LETGRLDEPVVFASRDPHHAVPPIAARGERGVGGDLVAAGAPRQIRQLEDRLFGGERLARPIGNSGLEPAARRAGDAVALAADLRRALRRKAGRVDDGRIAGAAIVERQPAKWAL